MYKLLKKVKKNAYFILKTRCHILLISYTL